MAARAGVRFRGVSFEQIDRRLKSITPDRNPAIWRKALTRMAITTKNEAKKSFRIGQPTKGPAAKTKITSRIGRLRGSIDENLAEIPKRVTVSSELPYAPVHEFGGRWSFKAHTRKLRKATTYKMPAHTRKSKRGKSYSVRAHKRVVPKGTTYRMPAKTVTYPARPYLAPGLARAQKEFSQIMVDVLAEELRREGGP